MFRFLALVNEIVCGASLYFEAITQYAKAHRQYIAICAVAAGQPRCKRLPAIRADLPHDADGQADDDAACIVRVD